MKRKTSMFCCATGVLTSLSLMFGGITKAEDYYNDKINNVNTEVVQYDKDTVSTKQYDNTYLVRDLINTEKGRIEEEKKRVEITVEISAYTNDAVCTGEWAVYGGLTASGKITSRGTVAVPQSLPFGTKLLIPNYKEYSRNGEGLFVAEDRGGYIQVTSDGVYRLDVWVATLEEAYKIGRVRTKAWIIKD